MWDFTNRVLAVASVLSEDMRCSGCGQPKGEAWNPDSEGYFDAHEATCQGCKELRLAGEGDREHRPEVKRWVSNERPLDVELRPWAPA